MLHSGPPHPIHRTCTVCRAPCQGGIPFRAICTNRVIVDYTQCNCVIYAQYEAHDELHEAKVTTM